MVPIAGSFQRYKSSLKPSWVTEFAQQREAALLAQRKREERERLDQCRDHSAMLPHGADGTQRDGQAFPSFFAIMASMSTQRVA